MLSHPKPSEGRGSLGRAVVQQNLQSFRSAVLEVKFTSVSYRQNRFSLGLGSSGLFNREQMEARDQRASSSTAAIVMMSLVTAVMRKWAGQKSGHAQ